MGSNSHERMRRDNWLSVLIGPFKFLVPTVSYIILYPLMIAETSIEVVGIWSLVAATVAFVSVSDIGFSQLLTREAGPDLARKFKDVYADYVTAQRAYVLMLFVFIAVFIAVSDIILSPIAAVYSIDALTFSVVLLVIGAFIQLAGKLDAAILSARHDNYIVQSVMAVSPILTYSAAIIGTLLKRPIEGLAIGTVLNGITTVAIYRLRIFHHHPELSFKMKNPSFRDSLDRFFSMTRRGWHLYSCSVAMMIRVPIYRLVIVSTVGLQAAAVFDIAMRITQTVREVVATGFSVLFPSFAFLARNGERAKTIELIQLSLLVLLTLGTLFLGILMAAIGPILSVWLGDYPEALIPSTRILAIWHIITLANVPFWYLLQATHNEIFAAFSIWAHTAAIVLIIPLAVVVDLDVLKLMIYWTATSVFTQVLIYYYVHKKLGLLRSAVLNPRIVILLLIVTTYSGLSFWISSHLDVMTGMLEPFVFTTAIFMVAAALVMWKPLYRFLTLPVNSVAADSQ